MIRPFNNLLNHDFILQGSNAAFEVILDSHQNIFEVVPQRAQGSAQVSLFVRDKCRIDYDQGTRSYNLRVRFSKLFSKY